MATPLSLSLHLKPFSPPKPLFYPPPPSLKPHLHHKISTPKIPSFPSGNYYNSSSSSSTPSETACPVPLDQQPINEYQSLSSSSPFNWAAGDFSDYCARLFTAGAGFALFVGLPVSWYGSVGVGWEPVQRVLGAASSGILVVTVIVVRMYLGWSYVGNRLLSATVEYEETGWYDGQVWVKTAEVLARDRLLGSYSVKPVLSRLKNTLVGLALSLFMCIVLLINTGGGVKTNTYITSSEEAGGRAVPGVYNDESARSFEPEAFCGGESGVPID